MPFKPQQMNTSIQQSPSWRPKRSQRASQLAWVRSHLNLNMNDKRGFSYEMSLTYWKPSYVKPTLLVMPLPKRRSHLPARLWSKDYRSNQMTTPPPHWPWSTQFWPRWTLGIDSPLLACTEFLERVIGVFHPSLSPWKTIWYIYWMFYDHPCAHSLLAKLGRWGWWSGWGWLERKARRH